MARLALPVQPDPDIARVVTMIRGRPEARADRRCRGPVRRAVAM